MGKMTTSDQEVIRFIETLQAWHESQIDQLQLVVNQTEGEIIIGDDAIPADSTIAKGIRLGVQISLMQLGSLPFSFNYRESEEDEFLDSDD